MSHAPYIINQNKLELTLSLVILKAMEMTRARRFTFTATVKGIKPNGKTDWVTDVDVDVQKVIIKSLQSKFPEIGIIGEEDEMNIPCSIPGEDIYFVIDPIDGTSSFNRYESGGFGPMIGLVRNGVIIAVIIGDAMTNEIYSFFPGYADAYRSDGTNEVSLSINNERLLTDQYLLLREPIDWPDHNPLIRRIAAWNSGLFKSMEVGSGGVGITTARLWKSNVGGCVLSSKRVTPWDDTPVIGMSKRLGFVFFHPSKDATSFNQFDPQPSKVVWTPEIPDTLIIHHSRIPEFAEWCSSHEIALNLLSSTHV